jgi:hypothetical protein
MTKFLFISHFFPPTGGAGVQRSSKFVKYLPDTGLLPVVVTGMLNPADWWTPEDRTLMADVPEALPVYRADWNVKEEKVVLRLKRRQEAYLKAAETAIHEHRPEFVFVSMSPFQDAGIAIRLSQEYGLPWIADLRDPWALDEFQVYRSFAHRWLELRKMRKSLASAAGIIMNTPVARDRLLAAFPEFRDRQVTSITNGFDPEDFPPTGAKTRGEKFRIVHTGSFHTKMGMHQKSRQAQYRLLGRCERGMEILPRSPYYLLQALEQISRTDPAIYEALEVVFAGVMSDSDKELISRSGVAGKVQITGYLGHSESAKETASADLLFLPLHGLQPGRRASIVPGKTYEYIGSGNPILAALPDGDAKCFVEASGNCRVTEPDNVEGIAEGIRYFFRQWESGTLSHTRDPGVTKAFERRTLTAQLADFLKGIDTKVVGHKP